MRTSTRHRLSCRRLPGRVLALLLIAVIAPASSPAAEPTPSPSPVRWEPLYEPGQGGATVSLRVSPHDTGVLHSGGDMLAAAVSRDRGERWGGTFGFAAYEMGDVTYHPTDANVVWFGSCMGPYVSTDGGVNFVERREGMPRRQDGKYTVIVEKVLFDPTDASRLLAIGGTSRRWAQADSYGWVWESRDGGQTWSHLSTVTAEGGDGPKQTKGVNLVAAEFAAGRGDRVYALAAEAGVFVSDDGGKTWSKHNDGLPHANVHRLAVHPREADTLWVSLGTHKKKDQKQHEPGGIYKSTDGGKTWQSITANLPQDRHENAHFAAGYEAMAVSPVDPDVIWTCDNRWNTGTVYKTEDGGAAWRAVATKGNVGHDDDKRPDAAAIKDAFRLKVALFGGCALVGMTADPKDRDVAYGFGTEYLVRTTDGGRTWTDISAEPAGPAGEWRGRGFTGWCSNNVAYNPYKPGQWVLQGMDAARAWVSDNDLQSFRNPATQPHPWLGGNDVSFSRDGTIFGTTGQFGQSNGIIRSTDGGKTFHTLAGAKHGLPEGGWSKGPHGMGIYVHPDQSRRAWAVLGGKMYATTDGGETWAVVNEGNGFGFLAADPTRAGRFYVKGKAGVFVTEDGSTYTNIGGPRPAGRGRINCDSLGRVYACSWREGRVGVWRYTPAASDTATGTWERLLDDYHAMEVNADPTDPNRLALVTSDDPYHDRAAANGVWLSGDAGKSWFRANDNLPMLRANAVTFDPTGTKLIVGTYGRGFFTAPWPKSFAPAGERSYTTTPDDRAAAKVEAATAGAPDELPITHTIRDFGDFDYCYGETWKQGGSVTSGKDGDVGYAQIDATEHGGGGTVLNGADITPAGQTHLAIRARLMAGNEASSISVNLMGTGKSVSFDLKKLSADKWTTLAVPLPNDAGLYKKVDQIQFQGTNFSPAARPLKIQIDRIGTTSTDGKANDEAKKAAANDPLAAAPAKDKPSVPGWGFWPAYPQAWQQTFKGQLARTRQGDIDVVFIGDSLTQGWGGNDVWKQRYAPLKAANFGIGGDSTRQVLYRIDNGLLDGLKPRLVVLMIGTNNLYGDFNAGSEAEIADGIKACVERVRTKCPEAKVLLLGLLPRQNEWFTNRIEKINAIIAKLDDGKNVRFLDMSGEFQTAKGKVKPELYSGDQLHLAKKGYELWGELMAPLFDEMIQ